jgi:hypothetical protein
MLSKASAALDDALTSQLMLFGTAQKIHFDWLRSVEFQLQMYGGYSSRQNDDVQQAPPQWETSRPTRSLPGPSKCAKLEVSHVKFAKETNDLGKCALPEAVRGGKAYSFNERFPLILEELPLPTEYEISDDDSCFLSSGRDEEIYDANPFEIHGKVIPLWARKEVIDREMCRQQWMDGDVLFRDLRKTCDLEEVFGA